MGPTSFGGSVLAKRRCRLLRRTGERICRLTSCVARRIEGRGSILASRSLAVFTVMGES